MTRRELLQLAAAGAGLLFASPAFADERDKRDRDRGDKDKDKGGDTYQIEVWAIRATRSNTDISPELRRIADELKDRFRYTGFKLEDKAAGKASEGKALRAKLPAGYSVDITPVDKKDGRITLKIQAQRAGREMAGTTIRLGAGKGHLMGGWKWDKDDVMILMVRAR